MLCFSSAPRYLIQVTESLIFKNLEIIRFCAKQYDLFYTVQAVSRKITQISMENHLDSLRKVIQSLKFRKLRSKVKNVLKKSVPVSSVCLVKRFSNKFFQCLRSSPPASTRSLQLPFVFNFVRVSENICTICLENFHTEYGKRIATVPLFAKTFNKEVSNVKNLSFLWNYCLS